MESSSSQKHKSKKNKKVEFKKENKIILGENNESIKNKKTSKTNKRINECIIQRKTQLEKLDSQIKNITKSVCKLKIETYSETIIGTGFLLKFLIDKEHFYCLLSNEYVIRKNIINNNNNIYIYYNNEYKVVNMKLDKSKRYIKSFKEKGLDITVVEILEEDNISKDYFLWINQETDKNKLINSEIFIPQYPQGKELVNTRGKIIKINKYEFGYLAEIEFYSSGNPIFLKNSLNVIGIHKQCNKDEKVNYGDFIYPVINIIKEDLKMKRNNCKYIERKYIWDDNKYYIGEFRNNLPNGKGIKYYSNGNILYEGNFINGKFEGNGKYYYEDGDYFSGEYKNGLRNGKGKEYYSNGNIKYEGDWINDKREGNGKYIWENGEYYIGQYKNGLKNGKGIMFYSNGNIKYEGD